MFIMYLSKGVLCKGSTTDELRIAHGDVIITLSGLEAKVWLDGRFKMIHTVDNEIVDAVYSLQKKGLAEYEEYPLAEQEYRALTRCICCPAKTKGIFRKRLSDIEKQIMFWFENSGIRLSTAELIYLIENKIEPSENLLHEKNAQALIETIYTKETIFDNILEDRMEHAKCRNEIVCALLCLLHKKRIVML